MRFCQITFSKEQLRILFWHQEIIKITSAGNIYDILVLMEWLIYSHSTFSIKIHFPQKNKL